jgi:hypothetical protein
MKIKHTDNLISFGKLRIVVLCPLETQKIGKREEEDINNDLER